MTRPSSSNRNRLGVHAASAAGPAPARSKPPRLRPTPVPRAPAGSGPPLPLDALLVAGLTLLAFLLRVDGFRDSLFGDELFLFRIVHDRGLADAMEMVHDTEKTPPFHFVLAWASAKLGDPTVWLRGPSLLFGTATVPLVYLLGLRSVGRRAALVGAAVLALDPFAIFYSVEARAYATVMFLVALSTLALLGALQSRRRIWWVVYGLATLAAIFTHYISAIVLAVQAAWAAWVYRDRLRELVVVHALIAVAYLPWVPSFLVQYDNSADEARRIAAQAPLSVSRLVDIELRSVLGHPYIPLRDLPGWWAIAAAVVVIVGAAVVALLRLRIRGWPNPSSPGVVIALLAVATPVGVALYSLQPDTSFMLPRNLSPSLPAAALLVGWLLTTLGRRAGPAATGVFLAVCAFAAAQLLEEDSRRPPYRDVARFVDSRARPTDPVVNFSFSSADVPTGQGLQVHFRDPHRVFQDKSNGAEVWELGRRGAHVFVVVPRVGPFAELRHLARVTGPGDRFVLRTEGRYQGLTDLLVAEYSLRTQ